MGNATEEKKLNREKKRRKRHEIDDQLQDEKNNKEEIDKRDSLETHEIKKRRKHKSKQEVNDSDHKQNTTSENNEKVEKHKHKLNQEEERGSNLDPSTSSQEGLKEKKKRHKHRSMEEKYVSDFDPSTSKEKDLKEKKNKRNKKRAHDEITDELPTAEQLLIKFPNTNKHPDNNEEAEVDQLESSQESGNSILKLNISENSLTTLQKTKRRKLEKNSASLESTTTNNDDSNSSSNPERVDPSVDQKSIKPRGRSKTKIKPSAQVPSPSLSSDTDTNKDEQETKSTTSEDSSTQVDYQLDKVLINSKNCSLLASNLHFPLVTQMKLLNLTCRDILASWLSFTQLNELVKIFGFKYKRGRFSITEKEEIDKMVNEFCKANSLTVKSFASLSRTKERRGESKKSKTGDQSEMNRNSLISSISRNLEGRPNTSIWQYIRRAYDPRSKLGPWTEEEENSLQQCVKKHGFHWTKIGEVVGRLPDDCKDRWRNYTALKGKRNSGGWSKEEEDKLIELMSKSPSMDFSSSENQVDGLWTWVSEQMGGSRSRAQCRIKWVENLKPKLDAQVCRLNWTNRDILILAQQLKKHNLVDEVGFDWRQVKFGKWSAAHLQRRWQQIKKFVTKKKSLSDGNSTDLVMNNNQILLHVLERWGNKSDSFLNSRVAFAKSNWDVTRETKK